jgi:hypothetical protein
VPAATDTLGISLGQFENTASVPEMEMQMITGTALLVTHWGAVMVMSNYGNYTGAPTGFNTFLTLDSPHKPCRPPD